jgi:hypothetical protein
MKNFKPENNDERVFEILLMIINNLNTAETVEDIDISGIRTRGNYSDEEISSALSWAVKFTILNEIVMNHENPTLSPLLHNKEEEKPVYATTQEQRLYRRMYWMQKEKEMEEKIKQERRKAKKGEVVNALELSPLVTTKQSSRLLSRISKKSYRMLNEEERNIFSKEALSELYQLRSLGMLSNILIEVLLEKTLLLGQVNMSKKDLQFVISQILNREHYREFGDSNRVVDLVRNDTIH